MIARIKNKNLQTWMRGYARHLVDRTRARLATPPGPKHILFAICDHYEPKYRRPPAEQAEERVRVWEELYPKVAGGFRDADGYAPRHSFFFPGEEYEPSYLDRLARLAAAGYGEVELHLHHDGDTAETLAAKIDEHLKQFAGHGHLSRDAGGRLRYAFIHGNWALANSRRDRKRCGVDAELPVLWNTGCYADFTFPSAPDECQPNIVNRIYWPVGDLNKSRSYEHGELARVGEKKGDRVLMIQGPLSFARRPGSLSVRIENGDLTGIDPPTPARFASWVSQGIHVKGRPEWIFVKVHTHGAQEKIAKVLLGDEARRFHEALTTRWNDGDRWLLHYVTAREMYNVAMAAMDGKSGDPNLFRDYVLKPPPVVR